MNCNTWLQYAEVFFILHYYFVRSKDKGYVIMLFEYCFLNLTYKENLKSLGMQYKLKWKCSL